MPSLKEFLSSGEIKPLAPMMSRQEASIVLGKSDGNYTNKEVRIEKYGDCQLCFQGNQLIQIDWLIGDSFESAFQINDGELVKTTSLYEFIYFCNENNIFWSIEQELSFDRQLCIRTCEKVVVMFDLDHCELQKVSFKL